VPEKEDDECEEEEEPEIGVKEILALIVKLQKALLSRGDLCICTAKMLVLAQDEVG